MRFCHLIQNDKKEDSSKEYDDVKESHALIIRR